MHGLAPLDHLCAVKFYKRTSAEGRRNYSQWLERTAEGITAYDPLYFVSESYS